MQRQWKIIITKYVEEDEAEGGWNGSTGRKKTTPKYCDVTDTPKKKEIKDMSCRELVIILWLLGEHMASVKTCCSDNCMSS